jgi:5-methyltetrahydropteroyltriglutamate--homocysteine methyltransferase
MAAAPISSPDATLYRAGAGDARLAPDMQTSHARILTTHTGSLPRPPALRELYVRRARGAAIDDAELAAAGEAAAGWAIERQLASGIDVGNDGEQQRESFFLHFRRRVRGLGGSWNRPSFADVERYPGFKQARQEQLSARGLVSNTNDMPKAVGAIGYDAAFVEAECASFQAALAARRDGFVETFMTAPSPGLLARAILNEHYDSEAAYLAALGAALQIEYEAIARRGFVLQLDCPDLALERHLSFWDRPLSEFLGFVERVVATINTALQNVPRDRVRMHVCWGNYEGPHDCDVPLAEIWPLLREAAVGGFVLPFATGRHAHEYRCLARTRLADDQIIVAGVIDSTTNIIEHPEAVAERIERVAAAVGDPRRVMAGTDCGFDTGAGSGRVAEDVVWAKLAALAEGARLASSRLF